MTESIDEPIDLYNKQFKDKFKQNCEEYFDSLVKKTNVSVEENKALVKKYNDAKERKNLVEKNKNKQNTFKVCLIVLIIVLAFLAIAFFAKIIDINTAVNIILGIVCIAGIIGTIVGVVKLSKKIKNIESELAKINEEVKNALEACWAQMSPLNNEYDWNIPSDLMEKTTPLIDLDHEFDVNKFEYLHEKFNFEDNNDPNVSTNYVISGNIYGNPFVLINSYNTEMRDHTYSNSITIHWTTTSRDSKGNTTTHHHEQVLTASITKPAAAYWYDTRLVFGNEACSNLSFTRSPHVKSDMSDKDILKLERDTEKEMSKLAEKAISNGKSFTPLSNSRFEGMFHAFDRDNEQEFRLMFTPLAQNNMVKLLQQSPYGDDFYFYKKKQLNYIFSKHSQIQNYRINPSQFAHYDIVAAKENFIKINTEFFKGLFFDLAPLLSVPLYQQTKTHEYIYNIPYEAYHTKYEQESIANRFDKRNFVDPNSKTDAILKAKFIQKSGNSDIINVEGHTYDKIKHTEVFHKMGGDGRMHSIPVDWYEYLPLTKTTQIELTSVNSTNKTYRANYKNFGNKNCVYERGLLSAIVQNGSSGINEIKDKIDMKVEEK